MEEGDDIRCHGAVDIEGAIDEHDHEACEEGYDLTGLHVGLMIVPIKLEITSKYQLSTVKIKGKD